MGEHQHWLAFSFLYRGSGSGCLGFWARNNIPSCIQEGKCWWVEVCRTCEFVSVWGVSGPPWHGRTVSLIGSLCSETAPGGIWKAIPHSSQEIIYSWHCGIVARKLPIGCLGSTCIYDLVWRVQSFCLELQWWPGKGVQKQDSPIDSATLHYNTTCSHLSLCWPTVLQDAATHPPWQPTIKFHDCVVTICLTHSSVHVQIHVLQGFIQRGESDGVVIAHYCFEVQYACLQIGIII